MSEHDWESRVRGTLQELPAFVATELRPLRANPSSSSRRRVWVAVPVVVGSIVIGGAVVANIGTSNVPTTPSSPPVAEGGPREPSDPEAPSSGGPDSNDAGTPLDKATEAMAGFYQMDGFAQVERVTSTNSVIVRWRGPLPEAVRAAAAEHEASGVAVDFVEVPFSEDELLAAGRRILSKLSSDSGWTTGSIVPRAGYDGLVVDIELAGSAMPESEPFERVAGVPVTLRRGNVATPALPPPND